MPIYLEYFFWLAVVALGCVLLERLWPWRSKQKAIRKGVDQDLVWLVFNQQCVGWALAIGTVELLSLLDGEMSRLGLPEISDYRLIEDWPIWGQALLALLIKDFIDWVVHVLLHRVPWMWQYHKLHHSIEELDWLGTFRSHWGEIVMIRLAAFLPIALLGADYLVMFILSVVSISIRMLSHANIRQDWGPLRYVINSPRFHSWHHDVEMHGKGGQNFGGDLVIWDWIFGTAYWPKDKEQPDKLGFHGMKNYPKKFWGRLLYPIFRTREK